ncbi:MAG: ABC transporter substrate-binding protein [Proteobacteria bacterium]|nr:ABC transporter substrate-binding protein [Pseudomonadota bacterium]
MFGVVLFWIWIKKCLVFTAIVGIREYGNTGIRKTMMKHIVKCLVTCVLCIPFYIALDIGAHVSCVTYGAHHVTVHDNNKEQAEQEKQEENLFETSITYLPLPGDIVWQSNDDDPVFTSSKAQKGGTLLRVISRFPLTFRSLGPDASSSITNYGWYNLSLLAVHPITHQFVPSLAVKWATSSDGRTVYYSLDPDARWSDGVSVTAKDFLMVHRFYLSEFRRDAARVAQYRRLVKSFQMHSSLQFSITLRAAHPDHVLLNKTNWSPVPSHVYRLSKDWQRVAHWQLEPNSGPYEVTSYEFGTSFVMERKKDWWGRHKRYMKGAYNFDTLQYMVSQERGIRHQWKLFLEEKSHVMSIGPKLWHTWTHIDPIAKGYIQKQSTPYVGPSNIHGIFLNLKHLHWQLPELRYAFGHAMDMDTIIQKVQRNEMERAHTLYGGMGAYSNSQLRSREYSPTKVAEYMKAAGYTKNSDGYFAKDGKVFSPTIVFSDEREWPHLKVLKEGARKAGIYLNARHVYGPSFDQIVRRRRHDVIWNTLSNPWSRMDAPGYYYSYHSSEAKKFLSANITNTQDPQIDALIHAYRNTIDSTKKAALSRSLQELIHKSGASIMTFKVPYSRLLHWRYITFPQSQNAYIANNLKYAWYDTKAKALLDEERSK